MSEVNTNIDKLCEEILKILSTTSLDNPNLNLNMRLKAIKTHIEYIKNNKDNNRRVTMREELLFVKSTCDDILEKERNSNVSKIKELCNSLNTELMYKELYK